MGFSYLDDHQWRDVTRDERFFCAELYFKIKGKEQEFIHWLKEKTKVNCISNVDLNQEWEVGFEVCFYRDYIKVIGEKDGNKRIKKSSGKFPIKRTFDLCLFSEKKLLIIEAKVQQRFHSDQNKEFEEDETYIKKLIGDDINIHFIALASSIYYNNLKKHGKEKGLPKLFQENCFSWIEIYESFSHDKVFKKAEEGYNK